MARETFADDLSRGDVEGREERGRAVALVVVAAPLRLPGAHRQEGLGTVQGLDLALFATQRTRARSGGAKYPMSVTKKGSLDLSDAAASRRPARCRGRVAARPRHRAKAPMGPRRLFQRQPDHFWRHRRFDAARRGGVRRTDRRGPPPHTTPLAHGVRARLETNGDLLVLQPFRRRQDDPSPPRKPLRRLATTRQRLQFGALVIAHLAINRAS